MKNNILSATIIALLSIPICTFAQQKTAWAMVSAKKEIIIELPKAPTDGKSPYWIIVSNEKEFQIDTLSAIKYLDPQWMSAVDFPDLDVAKAKYGKATLDGLVIVTIDDKKFSNAFEELKEHMAFIDDYEELPFYDFTTLP
ncbi:MULTISPECIES: hypothetical protein [unclassified Mucilaginibacter]|uniref:hypothetical protein n=1 Tax=unclassified Mucilaginibacter TaxID=2617802 RepID=UPI002AC8CAA0|nr:MULTISPECIES: hypothetical protein [unclassified Mucilaginibacter]MEB0260993.1 hypothetical protein [Mucilaginibacter sp. 10I4]MEB0279588.1 hypothetical protein [Mucilaginibacter sp. 10B2]MEB0300349.1 hypothetical protein [Mucilaginibacter sp. 5C4]WPX22544.1 hypothetical protein RHM67_14780 [Mucilaginibacter sp. 5C4]